MQLVLSSVVQLVYEAARQTAALRPAVAPPAAATAPHRPTEEGGSEEEEGAKSHNSIRFMPPLLFPKTFLRLLFRP